MGTKKAVFLFLLIFLQSCWPREMVETVNLIITNGLDLHVQMRFFSKGLPSGREIISKTGPGEIFSDGGTDTGVLIHEIFQADSIVIVFNNERIEIHDLLTNEPIDHNLFNYDSYQRKGDTWTYTIDTKNYNNATPCDGPCYE